MLIKNWFDKTREGFALGIAFVGSGAGAMVMNPLYTLLIQVYRWRTSFFLSGIFILAILVPLIFSIVARNPQELMKRKIKAGKYRGKSEETSNLKEQCTERAESGMGFRKGDPTSGRSWACSI
ncbi:MAG: MFS transporter [Anaerovoracaceae bacterium]|nr:MFS transporter [Anaerovoracaceae bacterium]